MIIDFPYKSFNKQFNINYLLINLNKGIKLQIIRITNTNTKKKKIFYNYLFI